MLVKQEVLMYVTAETMWVGKPTASYSDMDRFAWSAATISSVFQEIKKKYKASSLRIILGTNVGFVSTINIQSEKANKNYIIENSVSLLNHDLRADVVDVRLLDGKEGTGLQAVQIIASSWQVLSSLISAAKAIKIKIESVEPVAYRLALATESFGKPHVQFWKGPETLGLIAYKGNVYYCQPVSEEAYEGIKQLADFAKEKFNFHITDIIFDLKSFEKIPELPQGWDAYDGKFDFATLIKSKKTFKESTSLLAAHTAMPDKIKQNVEESPTFKKEVKEEVEKVISAVQPEKTISTEPNILDTNNIFLDTDSNIVLNNKKSLFSNKKLLWFFPIPFLIGILIPAIMFRAAFTNDQKKVPIETAIPSTPKPTVTPVPTINVSAYSVQILNGSGTPGEAGKVKALLEADGFSDFKTGNADAYDYTSTEIQLKKSVDAGVYNKIKKALDSYSVDAQKELSEKSLYDIVIVVGSKKSE